MMNTEGQIMANSRGEVVTDMSNVDQYKYTIEMDNVQVGGSAQTTAALGVTFRPMKGLRLNAEYTFDFGKIRATLSGNVNNLFNQEYIADARDGSNHDWETATRVIYGWGRTYTVRLKLNF